MSKTRSLFPQVVREQLPDLETTGRGTDPMTGKPSSSGRRLVPFGAALARRCDPAGGADLARGLRHDPCEPPPPACRPSSRCIPFICDDARHENRLDSAPKVVT